MSNDHLKTILSSFHSQLNLLVETKNYDLQSDEVQAMSKKMDRIIFLYDKQLRRKK